MKNLITTASVFVISAAAVAGDAGSVTYAGTKGPGTGKHVVLIAGDEKA